MRWLSAAVAVALLLISVSVGAASARAGEPAFEVGAPPAYTSQARAMNAEFLADPEGLELAQPGGVCMVDTGIDPAHLDDFAPGQVRREAIAGADPGTAASTHGTLMARLMGAQVNGHGFVGLWPGLRIVSVAVPVQADGTVRAVHYVRGVARCRELRLTDESSMSTVLLSMSNPTLPDVAQDRSLTEAVERANLADLSVVAAAGREAGPVASPASTDRVIAVGARTTGASATVCNDSPSGPDVDVFLPGCDLDPAGASEQGTSQAAALVAVTIAAIRANTLGLARDAAEALLPRLSDHLAAMRPRVVPVELPQPSAQVAAAPMPGQAWANDSSTSPARTAVDEDLSSMAAPEVTVQREDARRMSIGWRNRTASSELRIEVRAGSRLLRRVRTRQTRTMIRCPLRKPVTVYVRTVDRTGARRSSRPVVRRLTPPI